MALSAIAFAGRLAAAPVEAAKQIRADAPNAEAVEFFETRIRPVLVERCYECHSADAKVLQGGLRLDSAERMRAGGDSGPPIAPQNPQDSLLISAIRYESFEMPPSGRLPDAVVADFVKWVELGAPDPRGDRASIESNGGSMADPTKHWAFQPPQQSAPPEVADLRWPQSDVDRFILARLDAAGISPSPPAGPRILLRRLYYDLIGLPPTADELDEFAADPSDARYQATVDRLLASPRFGERWARYWLDIARYADTKGYLFEEDRNYKHAYLFRDWVIASFNNDRPYNEFIISQLAADQIDDKTCAPAFGFLTLGRRFLNNRHDIINDRIDVVTRGLMGLTVACARCHDHKYDPISADDYYAMYSVFANSEESPREDAPPALADVAQPGGQVVFLRGNPSNAGPAVERHFLSVLAKDKNSPPPVFQRGSGRREMADAIASRDNPLTARVWVNRVWSHVFGKGLVTTSSDFGTRGNLPTHPELLDSLACTFMEDDWSTKRLIRRMVLTAAYRQASDDRPDCAAVDPENQLQWRANRRRLDLEAMRDSVLVAAGRLDDTAGGPSVELTTAPFSTRRSVYGFIERQNLPAFFRTFDFANPNTHTPERALTASPQQALFLLNSPFVMEQAAHLAERSLAENDAEDAAARVRRINRMFRDALGREATATEIADSLSFIDSQSSPTPPPVSPQIAWQFGWGTVDDATGKVEFRPLPHFTGQAWQGGRKLPHRRLGWVMLSATGGHPGDDSHLAIRRWVADFAGTVSVEGTLAHTEEQGDGVRGRIVSSRHGILGAWEAVDRETITAISQVSVEPGDTLDFVVDDRGGISFDSFNWTANVETTSNKLKEPQVWDSANGFHGPLDPTEPPLSRWQELAQVLLMSNEFMFVD